MENLTKEDVKKEIQDNIKVCLKAYSDFHDRFLKDLEEDMIAIVEEGFEKLNKKK
jgi:hypothetical protein